MQQKKPQKPQLATREEKIEALASVVQAIPDKDLILIEQSAGRLTAFMSEEQKKRLNRRTVTEAQQFENNEEFVKEATLPLLLCERPHTTKNMAQNFLYSLLSHHPESQGRYFTRNYSVLKGKRDDLLALKPQTITNQKEVVENVSQLENKHSEVKQIRSDAQKKITKLMRTGGSYRKTSDNLYCFLSEEQKHKLNNDEVRAFEQMKLNISRLNSLRSECHDLINKPEQYTTKEQADGIVTKKRKEIKETVAKINTTAGLLNKKVEEFGGQINVDIYNNKLGIKMTETKLNRLLEYLPSHSYSVVELKQRLEQYENKLKDLLKQKQELGRKDSMSTIVTNESTSSVIKKQINFMIRRPKFESNISTKTTRSNIEHKVSQRSSMISEKTK